MEGVGAWSFDASTSSPTYTLRHFKDPSLDLELGYPCPFCSDDFYDLPDLCDHINDDHPQQTDSGFCPVCETSIGFGVNMMDHITMKHGSILKSHYKLKLHKQLSSLRKVSKDECMQSVLASRSSSNSAPDPLLSFISNMPSKEESVSDQPSSPPSEVSLLGEECADNSMLNRAPVSDKDLKETTSRCGFVQGLMLSLFLDDNL